MKYAAPPLSIGATHVVKLLAQRESRIVAETDPTLPGTVRWLDQLDPIDREIMEEYGKLVLLYTAENASATAREAH